MKTVKHDHCLEPVGLTFKQLTEQNGILGKREYRRYEKFGFGTPPGKVELKSSIFEELGAASLPLYKEPVWSPADNPEFCSPEIGCWPHSALLCKIEKENPNQS